MYNNPMYYNNSFPYQNNFLKKGPSFLGFRNINWSNILNNTQKTLNVINQAIPVYYQIKPIWGNAKTMLRMVNALKEDDKTNTPIDNKTKEKNTNPNGPVFLL